ncbi:unnamed protein product [Penicillium salamii]|uniref:Uncharacterized protein n=1 Tax=Penicillium salamii TaxID=1612424 RepID=A0A9W4JL10_9EURO|nr:unnamed protein product [Penicillium salamii]CAG8319259.1 unnamed protein product [Penicillium salamii]CAG8322291.1 unnamed protein product [Penicillium salamii]CAG8397729.1 unnamed protein product [Penicillium salamii]CAG8403298.1 unnamed protein product [Penicillium salamii]
MRSTLRLLANVKPRYLEPFAPTGLTGLFTHPSPRPTLIYLYSTTLQKLQAFPESSAYRQSVEALSRNRLQIVESQKPAGFDAWLERVRKTVGAEPERFAKVSRTEGAFTHAAAQQKDGSDVARGEEWDGEGPPVPSGGPRTPQEQAEWAQIMAEASETTEKAEHDFYHQEMKWESEPALNADQISEIEQKIGAGLIEEVIQVAESELKLVDELAKAKVWEELEEKPQPGQWTYFARGN